jgi:hypothetical protein
VFYEAYGGEALRKSSVFEWYKRFKESSHVEITVEENANYFLRYEGYCLLLIHSKPNSQVHYVEILKWFHEAVHRKRPELLSNGWILPHDTAPAHKALSVGQFLAQKLITEKE